MIPAAFRSCVTPPALALAIALASSPAALANNINEPEVEKGSQKIEYFGLAQTGFAGGAAGDTREVHNFNYYLGITDFWQIKAYLILERPDESAHRLTAATLENTFKIADAKDTGGIGLAWFTGISAAIADEETNAVVFGPIVRLGAGPLSLILNPFLEKTFGQNREDGMAFVYGWQLKRELTKGVWLGVEGFGKIPELGSGVPLAEQEHKVGPLLTFESEVGEKRTMTVEFGALFGLTEATPDAAAKVQLTYSY